MTNIHALVPQRLFKNTALARRAFTSELQSVYKAAMKKSILDYMLLDKTEQLRLGVLLPNKVGSRTHLGCCLFENYICFNMDTISMNYFFPLVLCADNCDLDYGNKTLFT